MFMAAELGAGSHRVELRYETPYIRAGALCTLAGMGAAGILFFYERKKKVSRRADRRKEKSQRSF